VTLSSRLKKIEKALGVGGHCEACQLTEAFVARMAELEKSLGIWRRPPEGGRTVRITCLWCNAPRDIYCGDLTRKEAAEFEESEGFYRRGLLCSPEYEPLRARVSDALERTSRAYYGAHWETCEPLRREYIEQLKAIRAAGVPYLCRLPGCACDFPKTLDEWRRNAQANGYRVAA
jgi:hypothetical protein